MKNILKVGNRSKNIATKVQKAFLKGRIWILVIFHAPGSGSRIPNTEPDPGQPDQCRSGCTTLLKRFTFFKNLSGKMKPFYFRVAPPPPPPGPWPHLSCSGRRAPGTAQSHRPFLHHRHISYLWTSATVMPSCRGRQIRRVSVYVYVPTGAFLYVRYSFLFDTAPCL